MHKRQRGHHRTGLCPTVSRSASTNASRRWPRFPCRSALRLTGLPLRRLHTGRKPTRLDCKAAPFTLVRDPTPVNSLASGSTNRSCTTAPTAAGGSTCCPHPGRCDVTYTYRFERYVLVVSLAALRRRWARTAWASPPKPACPDRGQPDRRPGGQAGGPRSRVVRRIGLDEISLKKRHAARTRTIPTDLTDPTRPANLAGAAGRDRAAAEICPWKSPRAQRGQ